MTETIPVVGDPAAQRDQLAAMAAEALGQRDRLLFTLGAVLEQFPKPEDLPGDQPDTPSRLVPVRRLREWSAVIHTLKSIDTTPLAYAALGSTAAVQPARAPDLPCPKCGNGDVAMRFCDEWPCDGDPTADPEHFHRGCRRCGYAWRTDDVLDAPKVSR